MAGGGGGGEEGQCDSILCSVVLIVCCHCDWLVLMIVCSNYGLGAL